jgi:hypothetical protein
LGIVEKQGQTFEVTGRAIGLDLLELRTAIPNLLDDDGSLEFDPGVRALERMLEALYVSVPSTNVEVEIVLPVPGFRCV